jgi:hypothetical protein
MPLAAKKEREHGRLSLMPETCQYRVGATQSDVTPSFLFLFLFRQERVGRKRKEKE